MVTAGAAGAAYCGPQAGKGDAAGNPAGNGDHRPADRAAAGPGVITVPGFKVTAVDTVGAGDTFVGALAVALAAGVPPVEAVTAAAAAARRRPLGPAPSRACRARPTSMT